MLLFAGWNREMRIVLAWQVVIVSAVRGTMEHQAHAMIFSRHPCVSPMATK